jgi:hypothetical protein
MYIYSFRKEPEQERFFIFKTFKREKRNTNQANQVINFLVTRTRVWDDYKVEVFKEREKIALVVKILILCSPFYHVACKFIVLFSFFFTVAKVKYIYS